MLLLSYAKLDGDTSFTDLAELRAYFLDRHLGGISYIDLGAIALLIPYAKLKGDTSFMDLDGITRLLPRQTFGGDFIHRSWRNCVADSLRQIEG